MTKSMRCPVHTLPLIMLALAFAAASAYAQTDAQKAFATLKTLPGTWEGKGMEGADSNMPVRVDFKITGGGSAIMSEIQGHADMISMFHMDGDRLLMTHYCAVGNQPRMQASSSPDGKTLTFNFVDATNLSSPDLAHMHKMILTVLDENHHREEWVLVDHGKEHKAVFDLHRKS